MGTWGKGVDPARSQPWQERALTEARSARRTAPYARAGALVHAGVGLRFVAVLLDLLVLVLLAIPVGLVSGGGYASSEAGNAQVGVVLDSWPALGLWLGYYVFLEVLFGGTIGKLVVGLRVIRVDGTPVGFGASLIRNIFRFPILFYLVAAIAVWTSPKKQRIGDRVAGTLVVKT
jgi:uncharacterized RDD family membrane protein YckC